MCEPSQCYAACSCAPAALKRAHKPDGGGGGAAAEPSEGTVIADGAVDEMLMRCSARAGAMSRPREWDRASFSGELLPWVSVAGPVGCEDSQSPQLKVKGAITAFGAGAAEMAVSPVRARKTAWPIAP